MVDFMITGQVDITTTEKAIVIKEDGDVQIDWRVVEEIALRDRFKTDAYLWSICKVALAAREGNWYPIEEGEG